MTIDWLRAGLAKPGKNQAGLAAALRLDPSAVSKVLAGKRRLKAEELVAAATYLEMAPPSTIPGPSNVPTPEALAELHATIGSMLRLGELDHAVKITETLLARLRAAAAATKAANASTPGPASGGSAGGAGSPPTKPALKTA